MPTVHACTVRRAAEIMVMRPKLADGILRQHLSLSLAAHFARAELAPPAVYDSKHVDVNIVARAVAKVAPLYVRDPWSEQLRQLSAAELEGAVITQAAKLLSLKSGRTFSGVLITRVDLRQAIAVLKVVGTEEFTPRPKEPLRSEVRDRGAELRERAAELELLLRAPVLSDQAKRANRLLISMARQAQEGRIANLAMQLMSMVHEAKGSDEPPGGLQAALARLRSAVKEIQRG
jgi:hypothetical protein